MLDSPFMNPPIKNPELDQVPGMAAPLPADAGPPSIRLQSMADTSLALGVALQTPGQWTYDLDPLGNARATFPGSPPGNGLTVTAGAGPNDNVTIGRTGSGGLALLVNAFAVGVAPTQNTVSITPGGGPSSAATITTSGTGPLQIQTDNLLVGRGGTINRLSVLPGATAATAIVLSPSGTAGFLIAGTMGFNSTPPVAKPTVSGSRAANAALASLLTALAATGLLTDGTTA